MANLTNQKNVLIPGLLNVGQLILSDPLSTINVQSADTNDLEAGTVVKLVSGKNVSHVKAVTATTDKPYGVVVYNPFVTSFSTNEKLLVAIKQTTIAMTAGESLTAGDTVAWDITTKKVIVRDGTNPDIGVVMIDATSGEIAEIQLLIPTL